MSPLSRLLTVLVALLFFTGQVLAVVDVPCAGGSHDGAQPGSLAEGPTVDHSSRVHGAMNHGAMNHGAMVPGALNQAGMDHGAHSIGMDSTGSQADTIAANGTSPCNCCEGGGCEAASCASSASVASHPNSLDLAPARDFHRWGDTVFASAVHSTLYRPPISR